MKSLNAVFNLYWRNPLFLLLSGGLVVMMAVIQVMWNRRVYFWIEDLMTLWLIVWMCQAFIVGLLLKRQAVSPLAGLLPGYRRAVGCVAFMVLSVVSLATVAWLSSMRWLVPDRALTVVGLLCVLTYLATVVVAYISVPVLVFISYGALLVLVTRMLDILDIVINIPGALIGLVGLAALIAGGLVWRAGSLREGCAEYPYLLTWPLYRSFASVIPGIQPVYRAAGLEAYGQRCGLAGQAAHWAWVEGASAGQTGLVCSLAAVLFMAWVVVTGGRGICGQPYGNFLLLVMLPLFITLMANYRVMAYFEHALMRPVSRAGLVGQWGFLLTATMASAWFFVAVLVVVAPGVMYLPAELAGTRLWVYLGFSLVFAQMLLAWIVYATTVGSVIGVAINCLFCVVLVMAEVWSMPYLSTRALGWQVLLAGGLGAWFAVTAFRRWCRKEVLH
ncbi:MAG: hypothetical protein HQL20_07890 [Candidatus Omnitrophica bacterium]|nr:hypothetical protein [Candidatus Omnitrophota bacterium]